MVYSEFELRFPAKYKKVDFEKSEILRQATMTNEKIGYEIEQRV